MNSLKEHTFPFESFIGGWYIPENLCEDIIKYFNDNKKFHSIGKSGNYETNSDKKSSTDLEIDRLNEKYPFSDYCKYLSNVVKKYEEKYESVKHIDSYGLTSNYNIQYYKKNEGFKVWHCENDSFRHMNRVLVFMTYLNDVPEGGTEFLYQKIITPAKKGLTLIWPSSFTHTHKGQITKNYEKYILTGWLNYLPRNNNE